MKDIDMINEIFELNITKEQKEILLKTLANNMLENMNKEEKPSREDLIEKNNKQAEDTREKVVEYEKKSYEDEKKRIEEEQKQKRDEEREKEIKEKEDLLAHVKNNNGEKIYKDLSAESGNKVEEIYNSFEMYNPKALEDAKKEMENAKNENPEPIKKFTGEEIQSIIASGEKANPVEEGPKPFTNEDISNALENSNEKSNDRELVKTITSANVPLKEDVDALVKQTTGSNKQVENIAEPVMDKPRV